MHRWSLEVNRTVHGDDHPAILSRMNKIGRVLVQQEKFEEAEKFVSKGSRCTS
jgi:hypothetical protein